MPNQLYRVSCSQIPQLIRLDKNEIYFESKPGDSDPLYNSFIVLVKAFLLLTIEIYINKTQMLKKVCNSTKLRQKFGFSRSHS